MDTKFNWEKLQESHIAKKFEEETNLQNEMDENNDLNKIYQNTSKIIHEAAEKILGTKKPEPGRKKTWVSNNSTNLINKRNKLKIQYRKQETNHTKEMLKVANDEVYKSLKKDKETQIQQICSELESYQSQHKTKEVYQTINKLCSKPKRQKRLNIGGRKGESLKNEIEQKKEWVRHFSELLNRKTKDPVEADLPLHIAHNLEIKTDPFVMEELNAVLKNMKEGKAPGSDNITLEAIKKGGVKLKENILMICNKVLETGETPESWREGIIIPIPKKGNLRLASNYRGITLLPIPMKIYNKLLLNRIEPKITPTLRPNQAGFLKNRGTIEHIHCIQ
jgi:hypothetical protein